MYKEYILLEMHDILRYTQIMELLWSDYDVTLLIDLVSHVNKTKFLRPRPK